MEKKKRKKVEKLLFKLVIKAISGVSWYMYEYDLTFEEACSAYLSY